MQELIQAAIQAATIPYTILFLVVLMYWLAVLIGIFDLGSADFDINPDIDVDVEVDIDADVDADAEADGGTGGGWLAGTLAFFNFGRVPFMIIMTFLILAMWTISILAHYSTGNGTLIFAAALFIPNLFVSLIFAKIITSPLVRVFKHFDGNVEAIDYIGKTCTLTLPIELGQMGQAEVVENDAILLISVKLKEGKTSGLVRGAQGLVVSKSDDGKFYWIKPLEDFAIGDQ